MTGGSDDMAVAIGGVGGSGTRVIASLVAALGLRQGRDRNPPQDDLTFTLLFKRPRRFRQVRGLVTADHPTAVAAARAFVAVRTGHRLSPDVAALGPAVVDALSGDTWPVPEHRLGWTATRLRRALVTGGPSAGPWTWKEPNTHLFLPALFSSVPRLRYIHVVRNGLAMATSKNATQLRNWGFLFEIDSGAEPTGSSQLLYWARANLAVHGFMHGRPDCLVVTHEQAVEDAAGVLATMAAFLDRPVTDEAGLAAERVHRPADFGRALPGAGADLTGHQRAEVDTALETFGFAPLADPGR